MRFLASMLNGGRESKVEQHRASPLGNCHNATTRTPSKDRLTCCTGDTVNLKEGNGFLTVLEQINGLHTRGILADSRGFQSSDACFHDSTLHHALGTWQY